jgi:hypothetical protein
MVAFEFVCRRDRSNGIKSNAQIAIVAIARIFHWTIAVCVWADAASGSGRVSACAAVRVALSGFGDVSFVVPPGVTGRVRREPAYWRRNFGEDDFE